MVLIEIKGEFLDGGEIDYVAAIGTWDGKMDDDHIFYWFESEEEVIGVHSDEFRVTSYEII